MTNQSLMQKLAGAACVCLTVFLAFGALTAQAQALKTNQSYVEDVTRSKPVDVTDPMSVFKFVFSALPDDVTVYPTENYYYFSFFHGGIEFAGNLRLDASDRDKGIVHFAYFTAYARWNEELISNYKPLTSEDGVSVEQAGPLAYQIAHENKSVTFNLNDLSDVRPPPGALGPDEQYLGPVFDESAIEMFFIFNKALNIFPLCAERNGRRRGSPRTQRRVRPHLDRPSHGLRILYRPVPQPQDPDRRVQRQLAGEQLF